MKKTKHLENEKVREIIDDMKAQGVLDQMLPPEQTGIVEIRFANRTVQCEVANNPRTEDMQ